MSEIDSATETPDADAETAADKPEAADTPGDSAGHETAGQNVDGAQGVGNREAARYRRKLRDTETERDQANTERDQLHTRLTAMQRAEVERLAADTLADPADVWRDGAELAGLLDDDGNVDPAKVTKAARTVRQAHPHWSKPRRPRTPSTAGGLRSGAGVPYEPSRSGLDAFRPAHKRASR